MCCALWQLPTPHPAYYGTQPRLTLVVLLHQLRLLAHQAQRLRAVAGVQRLVQPAEASALQALPHLLQQAAAACGATGEGAGVSPCRKTANSQSPHRTTPMTISRIRPPTLGLLAAAGGCWGCKHRAAAGASPASRRRRRRPSLLLHCAWRVGLRCYRFIHRCCVLPLLPLLLLGLPCCSGVQGRGCRRRGGRLGC